MGATDQADVVVVGYGPVGMAMAALLGRAGHRVVVLERYSGLYNLPRAAIFDDETMRTFATLGIADGLLPKLHVQRNYEWRNGAGELLIEHDFAETGRCGWAEWYMMFQPELEDALDGVCRAMPRVEVRHNSPVTAVSQDADGATLTVDGGGRVTAPFVVACDGGNSFVREHLGVAEQDFGFAEPWMVCDFRFRRPVAVPTARQVGDPDGPTSIISLGPRHHRFSFMLDSAEDFGVQCDPDKVWARVRRYLDPEDAELIRVATYTFRSRVAERWRVGRVLLAGDAAHQMPPFLGQGMCSGVRDAQNIAFKLDLVLRGQAHETLLDTYQTERDPHVRAVIEKGIELGRLQTIRDPERAAARDRELLARRAAAVAPDKIRFPGLGPGMLAAGGGSLSVQGIVDDGRRRGRLDQVVGTGFQLLVAPAALDRLGDRLDALRRAGVAVAAPGRQAGPAPLVADVDGRYATWFAELGCDAVAVRPDFYVFGTASGTGVTALAEDLLAATGPLATITRRTA
ncbi:bifunctional 3-(3-hydroxy-phenyl)propionate/3-hydroxycinnamic acid hydroxylase [Pseudonocardia sp. DSM 110487]|uniref:bifunctional 3-(3-hydroxy-phenyl)propionate/3-hydroxycinnamic acid hydroxylase n=1 Tax=Pseudonocardia sp. DSM 110487 TaxID=2865833 RepID=UPI001C69BEF7|nr:bifunctional 3-(3-hydroxy-phenyl)propionate/3-hydroxycinnamic acid hydroxylase [Pseudonocardia sp. DSM 110487]QYN38018.1 bifunctional 3-(3-hydroxy-phenyl)propionate/3-hydroxycinnamic acid hydroxylase [Pseudonocardia sp. DSM 110487]